MCPSRRRPRLEYSRRVRPSQLANSPLAGTLECDRRWRPRRSPPTARCREACWRTGSAPVRLPSSRSTLATQSSSARTSSLAAVTDAGYHGATAHARRTPTGHVGVGSPMPVALCHPRPSHIVGQPGVSWQSTPAKDRTMGATDRFQRWQKIAIDQLTYALNLFLALTIAVLGYWFSLLQNAEFMRATAKCFMSSSLAMLSISAVSGLACVLCRMCNFRGTAQRARHAPKARSRQELRQLGRWTWCLFYVHVVGFGLGVGLLTIALLYAYGDRLR